MAFSTSARVTRTIQASYPKRFRRAASIDFLRRARADGAASASKVTLPLARTVRTSANPRSSVIRAARSALRIVTPPTLTPRRSATHAVIGCS